MSIETPSLLMAIVGAGATGAAIVALMKTRSHLAYVKAETKALRDSHEALLKSEERYRLLVEGVRDYAIFPLAVDGTIVGWNAGAKRIKQYEESEITGRHFSVFYPEEDKLSGKPAMELAEAARVGRFEDEGTRRRKDGSQFWANVILTAIRDQNGVLQGFSKITRDITDKKNAETALRDANAELHKRMEADRAMSNVRERMAIEASQMKSEFLAKMSHEIRTPLNCILGMSDVLADTALDAEQKKIVLLSKRAGATLLHLVNDVLDLAKVEAGKLTLKIAPFDPRDVVDQCVGMLSFRASKKGIALSAKYESDFPDYLLGDSIRIQQILVNLISNAIKFTAKGRVELRISAVSTENESLKLVSFTVADTGIGIPSHLQQNLFKKFSQVDASIASTYGGTGLGLAISRHLAELMNGRIDFQSQEGIGSAFRLTVPLEITDAPVETFSTAAIESAPPLRILVVDDVEDNRTLISLYLKDRGHELYFAEDGARAVELAKSHSFQLILMDINMPGMDGFTATRKIRERETAEGRVPAKIVALTAYALDKDAQMALDAGCDSHAAKPITKEFVLKLVFQAGFEENL